MADTKNEYTWHWQEPGTAWKGICIYHLTLTIPTRKPLLGTLHIPDNDPKKATIQRTNMGEQLVEALVSITSEVYDFHYTQYAAQGSTLYIYDNRNNDNTDVTNHAYNGVIVVSHSKIIAHKKTRTITARVSSCVYQKGGE